MSSVFFCRIMQQLKPPGYENAIIDNYVPIFKPGQYKIRRLDNQGRFEPTDEEKEVEKKKEGEKEKEVEKKKEEKKRRPKNGDDF